MGKLPLSCWDLPSPSHRFSAHCRKSALRKNPPVSHATVSSDNLVCDTHQTTSPQGTQEAQVISESTQSRNPASKIKWKLFPLLSGLQGFIQGIFSHFSVKYNVTAATSQVLPSFSLQFVSSVFAKPEGLPP